jgi:hypothetical protein
MAPDRVYVPNGKGAQLQAQGIWSAGEGDDQERFLADLRALRDAAALGYDELAARTHYPDDVLKDAESGPSLPGLPILAAYVRACSGDVPEWEERWRRLGFDSRADPGLPVRAAGASPAAAAGARVSVDVAPPDVYDPERIRAVLRGIHHSDRRTRGAVSRGSAAVPGRIDAGTPGPATVPPRTQEFQPGWDAETSQDVGWGETTGPGLPDIGDGTSRPQPSWGTGFPPDGRSPFSGDVADPSGAPANGNHHRSEPSGASDPGTPDKARADAIRRDPFSADWLQDSDPAVRDVTEPGWQDHPDSGPSPAAADSWFTPPERAETGLAPQFTPLEQGGTELAASPSAGRHAPRPEAGEMPAAGATGFRPSAEEHAVPGTSWPAPGEYTAAEARATEAPATDAGAADTPATDTPATDTGATETRATDTGATDTGATETRATDTRATDTWGTADRTAPVPVADVSVAPARTAVGSAVPAGPAKPTREWHSDRLFLVRLLVIIVVAALIGSVLVLLLR